MSREEFTVHHVSGSYFAMMWPLCFLCSYVVLRVPSALIRTPMFDLLFGYICHAITIQTKIVIIPLQCHQQAVLKDQVAIWIWCNGKQQRQEQDWLFGWLSRWDDWWFRSCGYDNYCFRCWITHGYTLLGFNSDLIIHKSLLDFNNPHSYRD